MSTVLTTPQNQIIYYKNLPVATTAQLAIFFDVSQKNILDNFRNNEDRFIEGKHYFKLIGNDLKTFKNYPEIIGLVSKNAKHLILWTERGAARHAKMLDTDHAWDVFEQLEDSYFNHGRSIPSPDSVSRADHERVILNYYSIIKKYDHAIEVLRKQIQDIDHRYDRYRCKLEEYAVNITDAAQILHTTVDAIRDRLIREGLIEVHTPYISGLPTITRLTEQGQKLDFVVMGSEVVDGFVRDVIKITDDGMKYIDRFFK